MTELVEFLRARYDDDERVAKAWLPFGNPTAADREHIARHDPARVLAEVDAKRRILDLHAVQVERVAAPAFNPVTGERISDEYDVTCAVCGWASGDPTSACATVRLHALPYAGHPDYRSEWAVAK